MESYIIIGGGLAGLTAANDLAGNGHSVTVFEQSERLGGRAITQIDRGYALNLGPHALYRGGAARTTLRRWNIAISGRTPVLGATAWMVRSERKHPFIGSARSLFMSRMLGVREKIEAARILRLFASGDATSGESMEQWIVRHARSERVRDLAAAIVRVSTYAADLANLSADAALRQLKLGLSKGVLYLDNGWQTLIDGLAERARSLGVDVRCGEPAPPLATLDASGIILAVPPASVEHITGIQLPKLRPVRAACLDIGLRKLPADASTFALGLDCPLYFSVHSATAKVAREGAALVHVAKYLAGDRSDPKADRAELEQFTELAIPGWKREAEIVRFLPNMTVTHAIAAPEGRPDVNALGLDRVVIAGDWVGPDGMLADAAVSSALRAVDVVQRRKVQAA